MTHHSVAGKLHARSFVASLLHSKIAHAAFRSKITHAVLVVDIIAHAVSFGGKIVHAFLVVDIIAHAVLGAKLYMHL